MCWCVGVLVCWLLVVVSQRTGRFESTHGSVLNVHMEAFESRPLALHLSLSSRVPLSISPSSGVVCLCCVFLCVFVCIDM